MTNEMKIEDGGVLSRARCCHPRSEPELCFILAHDLKGPVTPEEAMKAVSGVCPALELIDSRSKNSTFTLEDVVADNASSRGFVLGPVTPIDGVDISALPMKLVVNGQTVQEGSSAAIYGHPAKSLAAQANMLARLGQHLEAGQVVMSGGATAAVAVNVGDEVQVVVEGLGTASFRVED
ncbi:MAG: 4-oxalocrotonate decarboxylase [Actinomycetia bacterium]|nr:4-oxalocrotonate decarboxylase [Actinomycetes bacterium]